MIKELGTKFENDTAIVYSDEGDKSSLAIYYQGNGDWYVGLRTKDTPRLFNVIRCCTSGSKQPTWFTIIISGIFHALRGDVSTASELFLSASRLVKKEKK